jgi:hypothetical protein
VRNDVEHSIELHDLMLLKVREVKNIVVRHPLPNLRLEFALGQTDQPSLLKTSLFFLDQLLKFGFVDLYVAVIKGQHYIADRIE